MRQVIVRKGEIAVEDVPAPVVQEGSVLVRVAASCISAGTELSGLRASGTPLWQKAVQNPEKVRRVLEVAGSQGITAARDLVSGVRSGGSVSGYSLAGVVVEVGPGVDDLRVGDHVACAGASYAHHAEYVRVPRNLVASVPDGLSLEHASTVTMGAIALQGVRRADPTLGETFVVIGLGVLGQLTAQLLRANGCQVIGSDLARDRVELATELGMEVGLVGAAGETADVARWTGGVGADGVIITASTPSNEVVNTAFGMTRRKGRVVLVGDVGLALDRAEIYAKELDFLVSTSYGPGRYDQTYEEHGLDYPIGYVRWTENRNMQEYLRLLATGRVKVDRLIGATYPLEQATAAYDSLSAGQSRPVVVLLTYPEAGMAEERRVPNPAIRRAADERTGVAVVGAGDFAKGVHLPNVRALRRDLRLEAIVSRSGPNAVDTAARFGARYSTTEFEQVLDDPAVGLVVITTRHDTHADMALRALQAGKHVLVEKPLVLTREELSRVLVLYGEAGDSPMPVLLTGFNRRFSVYGRKLSEAVQGRSNPMMIEYRMNAGYLPLDHWVHSAEGGGRNLGEACHIYDLFTFLTGARAVDVHAASIRPATGHYGTSDNFMATVAFDDGSVATLAYTALGSSALAKERMELHVDGSSLLLDDYVRLTRAGSSDALVKSGTPEKGHQAELEAMVRAIRGDTGWPIPLWQQVQASEIALRVQELITVPS